MIAAGDEHTAAAGREILDRGGNAVDAAVTAAFVSFISEIAMTHWGGSGLATIFDPAKSENQGQVFDFFSNMPGLGLTHPTHEIPLDFTKKTVDFGSTTQDFFVGRGSVAVPGALFGLCQLVASHGRLSLKEVLAPAIRLAHKGFIPHPYQVATLRVLKPIFTHSPSIREVFRANGRFFDDGDHLHIPHLAHTLESLAAEGPSYLRTGRLGQQLVADQQERGGLVTQQDFKRYKVRVHKPIKLSYRHHDILLPPPCSSGGVLIAFKLKLLSRFDVAAMGHGTVDHLQLLFEVMAAATRARRHWELARRYLEPEEAMARFLSEEFVADFASEVMMALIKGRPSAVVGEPHGPRNTTQISVVDESGLAVSLTTTAGESAGYIVPETGFIPNNMLGEADLFPSGFHSLRPGQRIFTMMTPAVVLRNGRPRLVTGSGGSIRIRSAILQTVSNVIDFDMPVDRAVNASRVHLENQALQCEFGYDPAAVAELESLGYPVNRWHTMNMYFGGAHSVGFENGNWVAAGDERRNGTTA